jgi:hypothetical protein
MQYFFIFTARTNFYFPISIQIAFSTNVFVSPEFQPAFTISGLHGKPQMSSSDSPAEVERSVCLFHARCLRVKVRLAKGILQHA